MDLSLAHVKLANTKCCPQTATNTSSVAEMVRNISSNSRSQLRVGKKRIRVKAQRKIRAVVYYGRDTEIPTMTHAGLRPTVDLKQYTPYSFQI